jgi:ribonuclease HI
MEKHEIPEATIYTDGACDPNPGHGGWAAVIIYPTAIKEIQGHENPSTNNRMELMAAIQALRQLEKQSMVNIYTDSEYLHLGVDIWMKDWIKRGWKRKQGKLANLELWQELDYLKEKHSIKWHWVKGHVGNKYNERVNRLAQKAIRYK